MLIIKKKHLKMDKVSGQRSVLILCSYDEENVKIAVAWYGKQMPQVFYKILYSAHIMRLFSFPL